MLDRYVYFNPLDRGNLYQINAERSARAKVEVVFIKIEFQSPRSGKFVSDTSPEAKAKWYKAN